MIEAAKTGYMLFDGDCGICSEFAKLAEMIDKKNQFRILPYQNLSEESLKRWGLDYQQCSKRMQVISIHGRVYSGAFGVNHFFYQYSPWSILVVLVYALPVFLILEIIGYEIVAKYRHRISKWLGLKACLTN